jgi:hypothetical protein
VGWEKGRGAEEVNENDTLDERLDGPDFHGLAFDDDMIPYTYAGSFQFWIFLRAFGVLLFS